MSIRRFGEWSLARNIHLTGDKIRLPVSPAAEQPVAERDVAEVATRFRRRISRRAAKRAWTTVTCRWHSKREPIVSAPAVTR